MGVNDQMITIPYAVPWNYFDPIVLNDMKDIIYRLIISWHKLDGIVFLEPSLGLYNVMNQINQAEIQFYGITQYLQDFYFNLGLKYNFQNLFFIGVEDKLNTKILLQNYLSQIYGNPSPLVWEKMNYTFTTVINSMNKVPPIQSKLHNILNHKFQWRCKTQGFQYQQLKKCNHINWLISFYEILKYSNQLLIDIRDDTRNLRVFKTHVNSSIKCRDMNQISILFQQYMQKYQSTTSKLIFVGDFDNILKLQKLKNSCNLLQKLYIKIKFYQIITYNNDQYIIFPNIIYQICPNINQNEDMVTLNFQITSKNNTVVLGVCTQEILQNNNHQLPATNSFGSGIYIWHSAGYFWHNSSTTYNNVVIVPRFEQDLISVSYIKQNSSISFFENQVYVISLPIDKVKNLNFCVAMQSTSTVVNLVY